MDVQVREVVTLKELKSFIRFPHTLYRDNPNWVPPLFMDQYHTLRRDKNPAFQNCEARYWLAYRRGRMVGRIAGILNRLYIRKWKQRAMRFGWFDFIDDAAVSEALLTTVESWARSRGMTAVHGPLGFANLDPEGMLVEGFDELGTLATLYNHPYYAAHMEKLGYVKDADWVEYELVGPLKPHEKISRIADVVLRRYALHTLEVRNRKELLPYARDLFHVIEDEYQYQYAAAPLTERQVDAYIKKYFNFITPAFAPVVLDKNNRMVAFGIAMPSLSRALQKAGGRLFPCGFIHVMRALRKNDRADLYLMAVRSEYQGKGVNAVVIQKMHEAFNKFGIIRVESNPELETNRHVREQWKYFDKRQHKRRRCFIKHLV
jgi:GNAT superfamily N-acetyltransferase